MKAITAEAAIPGLAKGNMILVSTPPNEHPSSIAHSSISFGIVEKKPFKIQMAKGILQAI